jgi:hypothetical protein
MHFQVVTSTPEIARSTPEVVTGEHEHHIRYHDCDRFTAILRSAVHRSRDSLFVS